MLAYVFWHRPRPEVAPSEYEERLRRFHASLTGPPVPGFVGSVAFRCHPAPWGPAEPALAAPGLTDLAGPAGGRSGDGPVALYEDWYLVADFGALGALNDAAVDHDRAGLHDPAAAAAEAGTGGVYRMSGIDSPSTAAGPKERTAPDPTELLGAAAWSAWFAKPAGFSYTQLGDLLAGCLPREGVLLWRRQMTLGPAPEFCVRAADEIALPAALRVVASGVSQLVWPAPG